MDATTELKGILSSLRDSWRRGQTRRVLSGLDDQRLKDIGLLSGQVRTGSAVHEPTQRWLDSLR
jgi:uncharacterized protein YjiS (DUF1127 family)